MYETKKENALKTLDKKQSKVEEINKVRCCGVAQGMHLAILTLPSLTHQLLEEDILPALEKLRKERGDYMRWASSNDKLERLRRFCVAFEYIKAVAAKDDSAGGTQELQQHMRDLAAEIKAIHADVTANAAEAKRQAAAKEEHLGAQFKELNRQVDDVSKLLVQETSSWTNKKEAAASERESERKLKQQLADLETSLKGRAAGNSKLDAEVAAAKAKVDQLTRAAEEAERTLAGVQSGKGTGDAKSLGEKLADARAAITASQAEVAAANIRAKHVAKELAAARSALAAKRKEADKVQSDLAARTAEVEACRAALAKLGFDSAAASAATAAKKTAQAAVSSAQETVSSLSGQLSALDFQFRDPEKGFDRSRVKGVVAKLLRVSDAQAATALEVLAGGKLYQVVVDTDATGKALLERGQLKQRVTIIPLNRVQARGASAEQQVAAAKVSGGEAKLALSLVGFDSELQAAMQYVFGAGFVCKVR
jgi:structural maintenance of chromosome 2